MTKHTYMFYVHNNNYLKYSLIRNEKAGNGLINTIGEMSKKIILELTQSQFEAIINLTDNASAELGCRDDGAIIKGWIRLVDRMLKNNGYKRKYA